MNWLMTRSPRERWLIYVMGGLILLFAVWQFAVKPVFSARATAVKAHQAAERVWQLGLQLGGIGPGGIKTMAERTWINDPVTDEKGLFSVAKNIKICVSGGRPEPELKQCLNESI